MAKQKKAKLSVELPRGVLLQVDITDIIPSPTNPRKHFKDEDLAELAASIKSVGVMQPLVLHKAGDEFQFHLISGERRLRASALAGLTHVPCMVYDKLAPEVVLEMQITENLQRQDINVMEESDAFAQLMELGQATAEVIADKLGKSMKYVYDRVLLQKVLPEVQEAIRQGQLTISHGKQFARLPLFEQGKVWENVGDYVEELSVPEVRDQISRIFKLKLSEAPFDVNDKQLVKKAGSCMNCTKRSGCNLVLFDDVKEEDICFDAACYHSKVDSYLNLIVGDLREKGHEVKLISALYSTKTNAIPRSAWRIDGEQESNVFGVFIEVDRYSGYTIGQVVRLCADAEEEEDENDRSTERNQREHKEQIDYDLKIAERMLNKLAFMWESSKLADNEIVYLHLKEDVIRSYARIDDDKCQTVLGCFGWAAIMDSNDEIDMRETVTAKIAELEEKYGQSIPLMAELAYVSYMIGEYFDGWHGWDQERVEAFEQENTGIDIRSIITELEQEAGHTIVSFNN